MLDTLYLLILIVLIVAVGLLTWKLQQIAKFCNAIAEGLSDVQELDFNEYE